jgi:HSP20 family protein
MMTLREAMDHLFDDAFTRPVRRNGDLLTIPAVDMYQTDTEIVVKAAVPGVQADEVQISNTGDVLTLKGETRESSNTEDKAYHIREHRWGAFERSVQLPTEVKADQAKADFENGVLSITLPKADKARPRTITVKAK